jgi:gas vesicle protein
MEILRKKIDELTILYQEVLQELSRVSEDNFREQLPLTVEKAKAANLIRDKLFTEYDHEMIKKCDESLIEITKQIKFTFDNMVEEKQKEISSVELELKKLQNKKKLVLYGR